MPIARHDSIRICIEIALVLIATILVQIFMLVWGEILDCVDDKLCHGTKKYNIMIGDNISNTMRGLDGADQKDRRGRS